jgi:hypothetical protein
MTIMILIHYFVQYLFVALASFLGDTFAQLVYFLKIAFIVLTMALNFCLTNDFFNEKPYSCSQMHLPFH